MKVTKLLVGVIVTFLTHHIEFTEGYPAYKIGPGLRPHKRLLIYQLALEAVKERKTRMDQAMSDLGCGGQVQTYTSSDDVVYSPGFIDSRQYPNNANCVWTLQTSPANVVEIYFDTVDVESSPDCQKDYIQIFDGPINSTTAGRYCGRMTGGVDPLFTSTGHEISVLFHSDESTTAQGFTFSWIFASPEDIANYETY